MVREVAPIDISHNPPTIESLTQVVVKTRRRVVIQRDGKPVAYLVPADKVVKRRAQRQAPAAPHVPEKYPTVASLAGAAGTLPASASWHEVRESARDEHLAAKFGTHV